jgi:hypothetical protein
MRAAHLFALHNCFFRPRLYVSKEGHIVERHILKPASGYWCVDTQHPSWWGGGGESGRTRGYGPGPSNYA